MTTVEGECEGSWERSRLLTPGCALSQSPTFTIPASSFPIPSSLKFYTISEQDVLTAVSDQSS
jgi:hypothetical protein